MLKLYFNKPTELQFYTFNEATEYLLSNENEFQFQKAFLVCTETLSEYKFNFKTRVWKKLK